MWLYLDPLVLLSSLDLTLLPRLENLLLRTSLLLAEFWFWCLRSLCSPWAKFPSLHHEKGCLLWYAGPEDVFGAPVAGRMRGCEFIPWSIAVLSAVITSLLHVSDVYLAVRPTMPIPFVYLLWLPNQDILSSILFTFIKNKGSIFLGVLRDVSLWTPWFCSMRMMLAVLLLLPLGLSLPYCCRIAKAWLLQVCLQLPIS